MEAKGEEEQIRRIFQQAGEEKAPEGFKAAVMHRLEAIPKTAGSTQSLIPGKVWGWILVWVGGLAATGLYLTRNGAVEGHFWEWAVKQSAALAGKGFALPELPVSFAYCGTALAIFALLHVLWMRKYLSRQFAS